MNNPGSNQYDYNPEILRLMKSGGLPLPFIPNHMKELQQPDYPMDFVTFMDQMIKESGMDRKTVIARSGLSESLAYKYLNGNKKTNERDYILAFCIALHLNYPQTQHVLRISGLPLLGAYDPRAMIIRMGIEQGLDRYQIDEYLENAHYPLIKISNDMPSAEIRDSMSYEADRVQNAGQEMTVKPAAPNYNTEEYEEIESSASAEHSGNAPFDYNYFGSMTLKNKAGKTYHLEAIYLVTGETFFCVMDDEQYEAYKARTEDMTGAGEEMISFPVSDMDSADREEMLKNMEEDDSVGGDENQPEEESLFLEFYESLLKATASEFFPYFMELDHLTDKKVADVMTDVNDTRNVPYRIGCHALGGKKPEIYIEMFNRSQPERREYYQMIETADHECIYTASHESYYMQIEMGDIFDVYFTKKREPEFFLQAKDQEFKQLDKRYQFIFNILRHYLHTFARSEDGFVKIPDEQFYEEESEFFAEMFVSSIQAGDIPQAKQALQEQEKAIAARKLPDAGRLLLQTVIDKRRYDIAQAEKNPEDEERYRKAIIDRKDQAIQMEKELGNDTPTVLSIIADVMLDQWRSQLAHNTDSRSRKRIEEILELMAHGAFSSDETYCHQRFEVYQAYAFILDAKEPEEAETYYLKALKEATKHHLDQDRFSAAAVAATYNNYAWVLWNKLGSEEAIIYYGRAIELMEAYLENGTQKPEQARKNLAHYGDALIKIYEATSRLKEKERLVKRLINSGVKPEE